MAVAMILALAVVLGDVDPKRARDDQPIITAPQKPAEAPKPSVEVFLPPDDDFGYLAWCTGAIKEYLALYPQVMPEVIRIEKAFPTANGGGDALKVYPELKAQAEYDLGAFDAVLTALEALETRPDGVPREESAKRGQALWDEVHKIGKARMAQLWMSWSPPARCDLARQRLTRRLHGPVSRFLPQR